MGILCGEDDCRKALQHTVPELMNKLGNLGDFELSVREQAETVELAHAIGKGGGSRFPS